MNRIIGRSASAPTTQAFAAARHAIGSLSNVDARLAATLTKDYNDAAAAHQSGRLGDLDTIHRLARLTETAGATLDR
jgi:hypothetical protein